jgi:hypothetical protein
MKRLPLVLATVTALALGGGCSSTPTTPSGQTSATSTASESASTTTVAVVPTTTTPTSTMPSPTPVPATSAAPKQQTVIYTCTSQPVVEPASFVLACADANTTVEHLQWSGWGQATAHASGDMRENNCTPDCADGTDVQYPASVEVTAIEGGHYTWMHVSAPQAPGGPYDYTLAPSGPR